MKYTNNALNLVTVKAYKGIGSAWIMRHLKGNESEEQLVSLLNSESKQIMEVSIESFNQAKAIIKEKIDALGDSCDGLVAIGDADFPMHRGEVKSSEKPIFIFYKGDLRLLGLSNLNVTVIGLLNPGEGIEKRERRLVTEIVKRGATVVSGLAFGCDSIGHHQTLEEGGKTIAILPSSLKKIIPAQHKGLAQQIVEQGGLLITEYYEEHKSSMELNSRYKERDRLQALFSDLVVLAASYAKDSAERWRISDQKLDSGARLAMGFAKDYGLYRAVMYDKDIDESNPMFDLNRQLLAEGDVYQLTPRILDSLLMNLQQAPKYSISNHTQNDLF